MTSKLQQTVSHLLGRHFGGCDIRENYRPEWLITEKGERLELDFFIESMGIAIEVQGRQHYTFVPYFHGDSDGFQKRLLLDAFKREVCKGRGIDLIEVSQEHEAVDVLNALWEKNDLASHNGAEPTRPARLLKAIKGICASISLNDPKITPSRYQTLCVITNRLIDLVHKDATGEAASLLNDPSWGHAVQCIRHFEVNPPFSQIDTTRGLTQVSGPRREKARRAPRSLRRTACFIGTSKSRHRARKLLAKQVDSDWWLVSGGMEEHRVVFLPTERRFFCDCRSHQTAENHLCSHVLAITLLKWPSCIGKKQS